MVSPGFRLVPPSLYVDALLVGDDDLVELSPIPVGRDVQPEDQPARLEHPQRLGNVGAVVVGADQHNGEVCQPGRHAEIGYTGVSQDNPCDGPWPTCSPAGSPV